MTQSFEFPGEYYEIIRKDFRDLQAETEFFDSYLPPKGRVLDLGCGTGTNLRALDERGHRCVGIDQSRSFVEYARRTCPDGVELIHGRATEYEDAEQFDLILCEFVTLNYMRREEVAPLVEKARKLLRPGGAFVVDIGHMLNFADNYKPYIITHHRQDDILITRLTAHRVNPHQANWRHEESILVRDGNGAVSVYENFFDQMVLTAPELMHYLRDAGFVIAEQFGSFRKDPPPRNGREHLIFVARLPLDSSEHGQSQILTRSQVGIVRNDAADTGR